MLLEDRFCPSCGQELQLTEETVATIEISLSTPPPPAQANVPKDGEATIELRPAADPVPPLPVPAAKVEPPRLAAAVPPPLPRLLPGTEDLDRLAPTARLEIPLVATPEAPPPPPPTSRADRQPAPQAPPPLPRHPKTQAARPSPGASAIDQRRRQVVGVVATVAGFLACAAVTVIALRSGWLPWPWAGRVQPPSGPEPVSQTGGPLPPSAPAAVINGASAEARPALVPTEASSPNLPDPGREAEPTPPPTAATTSAPSARPPEVPRDGLLGRWSLDEGSGARAADSSGMGHDGVLRGAAWAAGQFGQGLRLDGTGGHLELPNSSRLNTLQRGPFTLAVWFEPLAEPAPDPSGDPGQCGIVVKAGWHEGLTYSSGRRFTMQHWLEGNLYESVFSISAFAPGNFYHVAGVVDPRSATTLLYVNGRLEGSRQWATAAPSLDLGPVTWKVGIADPDAETYRWPALGVVDELVIYERALSPDEIARLAGRRGNR